MFRNKLLAVFTFIITASLIYVTRYTLPTFSAMMPDSFLKILFWIGYVEIIMFGLLIKPITLFVSDNPEDSPMGMFYAVCSFLIGIVIAPVLYYLYDGLFTMLSAMTAFTFSDELNGIVWFLYMIVNVMLINVMPIVFLIVNPNDITNKITGKESPA